MNFATSPAFPRQRNHALRKWELLETGKQASGYKNCLRKPLWKATRFYTGKSQPTSKLKAAKTQIWSVPIWNRRGIPAGKNEWASNQQEPAKEQEKIPQLHTEVIWIRSVKSRTWGRRSMNIQQIHTICACPETGIPLLWINKQASLNHSAIFTF